MRKTFSSPWVSRFRGSPDSTRGGAGSSCRWKGLAVAVFVCALTIPTAAQGALIYEGFGYSAGSLEGETGGTGDWKGPWAGNSDVVVVAPGGLGYTDTIGNLLDVSGNHIELDTARGSPARVLRPLNNKIGTGTETLWLSVLLDGSSENDINNLTLGGKFFIGQGGKDNGSTTFQISDQAGVVGDTPISASDLAYLVARVDFSSGDEDAWLWVNPLLDAEPNTASADARGSVQGFEFDFVEVQLESAALTGLDEIRLGSTYAEVSPYYYTGVPVPEPGTSTLLLVGACLIALAAAGRRKRLP